jgi:hypothetical protein
MRTHTRLILLALLVVSVAACSMTSDPDTPTVEIIVPTPTPPNTLTYVDEVVGFAIDYPADWWIEATPGEILQIYSAGFELGVGSGGFPPEHTKIELMVARPGEGGDLEQDIADSRPTSEDESLGIRIVSEGRISLAGDVPAYRREFVDGMGIQKPSLITVIHGRSLWVSVYGDSSRFDEIVLTLRPVVE